MYVWELVAGRLRGDGWDVWHSTEPAGADGPIYTVHLSRPGFRWVAHALTLTEAYASAARQARECGFASIPRPLSTRQLLQGTFAGRG